ncbi:unnamed protein product, partial [Allacma fusca]
HPNTNVLTVGCHLEVEVDQGSGLGNLPMDTVGGEVGGTAGGVKVEITDLTEEVVLVGVPLVLSTTVGIRVEHADSVKVGSHDEGWAVVGITNQLTEVVHDDGSGDQVLSGGEVNDGGGESGGSAVVTTAGTRRNGGVDASSVIRDTISSAAEIHNITEDLVVTGAGIEGWGSVSNGAYPHLISLDVPTSDLLI